MRDKKTPSPEKVDPSRRLLLKTAATGVVLAGSGVLGPWRVVAWAAGAKGAPMAILADLSKCTGCRLCEMFCSSFNASADGLPPTLGNPWYARITVANFNPDIDIPVVCAMCPKPPCVEACPVDPDKNGRKAIYRDKKTGTITSDPARCVFCGNCEGACVTGTIRLDPVRKHPMGMCTLCGGQPQCVKRCPAGALTLAAVDEKREFYGQRAEAVFKVMAKRWYGGN